VLEAYAANLIPYVESLASAKQLSPRLWRHLDASMFYCVPQAKVMSLSEESHSAANPGL